MIYVNTPQLESLTSGIGSPMLWLQPVWLTRLSTDKTDLWTKKHVLTIKLN